MIMTQILSRFKKKKLKNAAHFRLFLCFFFNCEKREKYSRPPSHFIYLLTYRERRVSERHLPSSRVQLDDESEVQFNDVDGNLTCKGGRQENKTREAFGVKLKINLRT